MCGSRVNNQRLCAIVRRVCIVVACLVQGSALGDVMSRLDVQQYSVVGSARLSVLFWDIYDAQLLTKTGRYDPTQPFVLAIQYLRSVTADELVSHSISEIEAHHALDPETRQRWTDALMAVFPAVSRGDELKGVFDPQTGTTFFLNQREIGVLQDLELSRRFFDIWLGEKTSKPQIRRQLLGSTQ